MKLKLTFSFIVLFFLGLQNVHAYSLGSISLGADDSIRINQPFDITWNFGIYESHFNDPHPAMDVPMGLFLSNDEVWDSTDLLIATDVQDITEQTGYTGKAKYDIKIPYNAAVATGERYLILVVDPNNVLGVDAHEKPYTDFEKIFLYATVPDVAANKLFVKQVTNPQTTSKLRVDARIMNCGNQDIASTTFRIDVANSRSDLSSPLFSYTLAVEGLTMANKFDTLINTIDLEGTGVNKEDFYVKITLVSTMPGDTISRNDTMVQHHSWSKLDTFDITRRYVYMKADTIEITSCNADIYDNGGPDEDYSNNINSMLIIRPSIPGAKVRLKLQKDYRFYAYYDYLNVYDSADAKAYSSHIDVFTSSTKANDFVSNAADGSLKIQFYSDESSVLSGFHFIQTCVDYKERRDSTEGCSFATYGSFTFHTSKDTVIKYGLDSAVILHVTVHPKPATSHFTLKGTGSYTFDNQVYTTSTDITKTVKTANDCDSTVIYHIEVEPWCYPSSRIEPVKACTSTTIDGETITASKTKKVIYKSIMGCDSAVTYTVTITQPVKQFDLGADTTITKGQSVRIGTTAITGETYKWSTGITTASVSVSSPATYTLTASNDCGSWADSIRVKVIAPCKTSMNIIDTNVCESVVIDGETIKTSKSKTVVYTLPGGCDSTVTYIVAITKKFAITADDIHVVRNGNDKASIGLGTFPNATYLWSTGEKSPNITVSEDGTYSVTVSNSCGEVSKRYIVVHGDPLGINKLNNPQVIFHPNPAGNSLTISNIQTKALIIRDLNGKTYYKSDIQTEDKITIDVSGWNNATYFIYTMVNGNESFAGSFVKK